MYAITLLALTGLVVFGGVLAEPTYAAPGAGQELDIEPLDTWHVTGMGPATEIDWASLVWAMTETRDRVYVGGRFEGVRRDENAATTNQSFLAAFDVNTGAWISGFRPTFDGAVYALDVAPDGSLLVGGEFSRVNNVNTGPLVSLDPITGARRSGFDARLTNVSGKPLVMDIQTTSDAMYVGGNFSQVTSGGITVTRGRLAKLDPKTGRPAPDWTPTADGERVMAIQLSPDNSRLYIGGYFGSVNATADTRSMAVLRTDNGALVPGVDHGVPEDIPNCCAIIPFDFEVFGNKVYAATESHLLIVYNAQDMSRVGFYHTNAGGGDYQALAVDGTRLWAGGHYWTSQSWDTKSYAPGTTEGWYWNSVHRTSASLKPQPWASAYDASTGAHIDGYVPDMASINGIWAIHPASNGSVWFGGDLTRAGSQVVGGFAVFRPVATPTHGPNLALRRTATQSSTSDKLVAGRGTDGMLSGSKPGRSFQSGTNTQNNPWWQVDLGSVRNIASIRVWKPAISDAGALNQAKVFVSENQFGSNDPTATARQAGVRSFTIGSIARRADIDVSARGRYVRVQLPRNAALILDEVEVFEATGNTVVGAPVAPAKCTVAAVNGAIQVSWTRASNDLAQQFVVRRKRGTGSYFWATRTGAQITTWTDAGVSGNDLYSYRVETVGGGTSSSPRACTPSPISPSANGGNNGGPIAPTSCRVTAVGGSLFVRWIAALNDGASSYVVTRSRNSGTYFWAARRSAPLNTWTDNGVQADSEYRYRVQARSANSASVVTDCGAAQRPVNTAVPTGLRVANTTRERVVLNYEIPTEAESVEIARDGKIVARLSESWFTDTGLGSGRSYRYKIRSVAPGGALSAWSAEVTAQTG